MQKKRSKNYWPHGIIISLLLITGACIYTIVEAVRYPVELDTYYFDTKQNVDRNYDKIRAAQESFEKKYTVFFEINGVKEGSLNVGDNNSAMIVVNSSNECAFDAIVELRLTRPETNKYNQNLTVSDTKQCKWLFTPVSIEKIGRWQFQTKIIIGEDIGFFTYEANATLE
jgi:hypothetical protein